MHKLCDVSFENALMIQEIIQVLIIIIQIKSLSVISHKT